MRAVNLLPRQVSGQRIGVDRTMVLGIAVTVLVAVLVAGGFFIEKSHAASEAQRAALIQAALERAQAAQQSGKTTPAAQLQIPVVLSQAQPWHLALTSALSTRVAWDTLLQQLEYVVPDRITITNVALGGAGAVAGGTTGSIALGGTAFSSDDIAVFESNLQHVPGLSQVTLVSSTANSQSPVHTFQMTAQMALPAALTAPPVTNTTTTTGG